MSSLLLLNGSPRGTRSNSMKMLTRVGEGWVHGGGDEPEVLHLALEQDRTRAVEAFGAADTVVLGMPLYADSMPGLVMGFIETLAPYVGREGNPRFGFLVQSGFPEALHSRPLERYLAKLATRLGCEYAGTIVRPGGEALQVMPDRANKKLWESLREVGKSLHVGGEFDSLVLSRIAGKERLSPTMVRVMSLASKAPVTEFYWNGLLKKNGAWGKRFDAPYASA
ncbi:MAG: NAD(P)H-dependent oxidoreductase [Actinomycetota bacterium]|jgi:hypothetical protein|nr:NAD(P)H-dependent oxidoreductase [Actinomycetota bacterium]